MVDVAERTRDAGNTIESIRHDWDRSEAEALYALPFADLMFRAQGIHRRNFDPNHVEMLDGRAFTELKLKLYDAVITDYNDLLKLRPNKATGPPRPFWTTRSTRSVTDRWLLSRVPDS